MSILLVDPHDRSLLHRILSEFAARIDRVAVFGSRALGTARVNSDIDLVVYGRLDSSEIDRLWTLLDDSAISVSVDVLGYTPDLYPPLRRHIDSCARTLFTRAELLRDHII